MVRRKKRIINGESRREGGREGRKEKEKMKKKDMLIGAAVAFKLGFQLKGFHVNEPPLPTMFVP